MKTRQEMIYDFMLALSSSGDNVYDMIPSTHGLNHFEPQEAIHLVACTLADKFLESAQ